MRRGSSVARTTKRSFEEATADAQAEYDVLLDVDLQEPLDDAWDEEADAFEEDLEQQTGGDDKEITSAIVAALVAYLGVRARRFAERLADLLRDSTTFTYEAGLKSLSGFVKAAMGRTSTLLDSGREVQRLVGVRNDRLLQMRATSAANFGRVLSTTAQQQLLVYANMSAAVKPSVLEIAKIVSATVRGQEWRATRVVVTEAAYAYNQAQVDGMRELARRDPALRGLMMRWTERIDDAGRVLDSRVAADSIVLHGQVAPPGGVFTFPPDAANARVSHKFIGRSWPFPPNRPHDRAVLTPWVPGCGQPAWTFSGGRRRDLS